MIQSVQLLQLLLCLQLNLCHQLLQSIQYIQLSLELQKVQLILCHPDYLEYLMILLLLAVHDLPGVLVVRYHLADLSVQLHLLNQFGLVTLLFQPDP